MSDMNAKMCDDEQQLVDLRDKTAALIERLYGKRASFVLTFTLDGSPVAAYCLGGERPAAILALRGLLQPGFEFQGAPADSLIEADQGPPVGSMWIDILAALRPDHRR